MPVSTGNPSPARPPNERDMLLGVNGSPKFLGVITSAGPIQNNLTTAIPFSQTMQGPVGSPNVPLNFAGTLAGKVLLLQVTASGQILPSSSSSIASPGSADVPVLTDFATFAGISGTALGPVIAANERVVVCMLPNQGWLQWLPGTSGSCIVWELQ